MDGPGAPRHAFPPRPQAGDGDRRSQASGSKADRLVLALDFRTEGRDGRLVLRGRPVLDPGTSVLRLADLQYDLESGGLFLRLADRLHRAELLAGLQKAAHLDLAPLLAPAERETARAIQGLFPPGLHGEVRVEPVHASSAWGSRAARSAPAAGWWGGSRRWGRNAPASDLAAASWAPSRRCRATPPSRFSAASLREAPAGSG